MTVPNKTGGDALLALLALHFTQPWFYKVVELRKIDTELRWPDYWVRQHDLR